MAPETVGMASWQVELGTKSENSKHRNPQTIQKHGIATQKNVVGEVPPDRTTRLKKVGYTLQPQILVGECPFFKGSLRVQEL